MTTMSREEFERIQCLSREDFLIEYLDKKIARMNEEEAK